MKTKIILTCLVHLTLDLLKIINEIKVMLFIQSLVCVAEWYYSSLKAVNANNNSYIPLLRKTLKTNLYLTAERICSYKIVYFIFYSSRSQLNERMKEF